MLNQRKEQTFLLSISFSRKRKKKRRERRRKYWKKKYSSVSSSSNLFRRQIFSLSLSLSFTHIFFFSLTVSSSSKNTLEKKQMFLLRNFSYLPSHLKKMKHSFFLSSLFLFILYFSSHLSLPLLNNVSS